MIHCTPYYFDGAVTLYQGDCLDILSQLSPSSIDCIVTSPPYPGADMWQEGNETNDQRIERLDTLNEATLALCFQVLRDGGVACWNIQDIPYGNHGIIATTTTTTTVAVEKIGYSIRGHIIWDKGIPHLPAPAFMRRPCIPNLTHESILILFKGDWQPREKLSGLSAVQKAWLARGVWRIPTASAQKVGHPAPFPFELARRLISLFSLEGECILDPFVGSGTTLLAARATSRVGIGIETSREWCDLAVKRLRGDNNVLDESGMKQGRLM